MGMAVAIASVLVPSSPASAAPPTDGATRLSMWADQSPQSPVNFHTWNPTHFFAINVVPVDAGTDAAVTVTGGGWTIGLHNTPGAKLVPGDYESDDFDPDTPPVGIDVSLSGYGPACTTTDGAFVIYEADFAADGTVNRFSGDIAIFCGDAELDFAIRFHALPDFDPLQPGVEQFSGDNRMQTAVLASQDQFGDTGPLTTAGPQTAAVVLARSDDYADALAGTPLAVKLNAPLLLTPGNELDPDTLDEIDRSLYHGTEVHILGGPSAIGQSVVDDLTAEGFHVIRHAGADRFATAVAIANALGNPAKVLLVTGRNFPDGLAAGAAAAVGGASILLTDGGTMPAATASYLAAHPSFLKVAVGGPAAQAAPGITSIVGADRYETSAKVASQLFGGVAAAGLASGENFPDALSGGAHIARFAGPLLLTRRTSTPASVRDFLNLRVHDAVIIYGGDAAVSENLDPFS
jgi:putative cell wall-binding protein